MLILAEITTSQKHVSSIFRVKKQAVWLFCWPVDLGIESCLHS